MRDCPGVVRCRLVLQIAAMLLVPATAGAMELRGLTLESLVNTGKDFIFVINPENGNTAFLPGRSNHAEASSYVGAGSGVQEKITGTVSPTPLGWKIEAYPVTVVKKFPQWSRPARFDNWLKEFAALPQSRPLLNAPTIRNITIYRDGKLLENVAFMLSEALSPRAAPPRPRPAEPGRGSLASGKGPADPPPRNPPTIDPGRRGGGPSVGTRPAPKGVRPVAPAKAETCPAPGTPRARTLARTAGVLGAFVAGISGAQQEVEAARKDGRNPSYAMAVLRGWYNATVGPSVGAYQTATDTFNEGIDRMEAAVQRGEDPSPYAEALKASAKTLYRVSGAESVVEGCGEAIETVKALVEADFAEARAKAQREAAAERTRAERERAVAQQGRHEYDTDRPGGDYRSFDLAAANPRLCAAQCASEAKCLAWTYVKPGVQAPSARCWLKHLVPEAISASFAVSGVRTVSQAAPPLPSTQQSR